MQPNLKGTVVTQFSIDKDGKVQDVKASGMSNKAVEQCIATAIKSIEFPKPESRGTAKIRYPFTFTPGK